MLQGLGAVDQCVRSTVYCEQRDGRAALLAVCFCFKPSAAVLHLPWTFQVLPTNAPLATHPRGTCSDSLDAHALIYTTDPVDLIALIRRAQDGQPAKDLERAENLMPMAANLMGGMPGRAAWAA